MSNSEKQERLRVLEVARAWLGTPFHHGAAVKGAGVDCAMLIRSAFVDSGLDDIEPLKRYSPQWFINGNDDLWMPTLMNFASIIEETDARPADVVLYKFGHKFFSHGAIILERGWPHILHAFYQERGVVIGIGTQGILAIVPRCFVRRKAWMK